MYTFSIEKLRALIENKQISFTKLEKEAGISLGIIKNMISKNSKNPTIETLTRISNVLECSLYDLLINDGSTRFKPKDFSIPLSKEEWKGDLYLDVTKICKDLFAKNNLKLDFKAAMEIIIEVYLYSIQKNNSQIDLKFTEWTIEKMSK